MTSFPAGDRHAFARRPRPNWRRIAAFGFCCGAWILVTALVLRLI